MRREYQLISPLYSNISSLFRDKSSLRLMSVLCVWFAHYNASIIELGSTMGVV